MLPLPGGELQRLFVALRMKSEPLNLALKALRDLIGLSLSPALLHRPSHFLWTLDAQAFFLCFWKEGLWAFTHVLP